MKKIISGLFILLLCSSVAFAQGMRGRGGAGNEAMYEKLNLTDKQQKDLKLINEEFRNALMEMRQAGNLSEDEMRAERIKLSNERRDKIKKVLTPEQQKTMEDMEAAARPSGGFNIEELKERLNLSDEQVSKFKEIKQASREKEMSQMRNSDMSEDQRRQVMDQMRKNNIEIIKGLLTPAQLEEFNKMLAGKNGN